MKSAMAGLIVLAAAMSAPAAANGGDIRDAEANRAFVQYPKKSLKKGEQGTVRYRVRIDSSGRPRECVVTGSSGFRRLDLATCNLLMENAQFTPQRDSSGRPTKSTYEGRVVWRIS